MMGDSEIAELEQALARELPRFGIRYKDESRLQRLIGRLLRPFNGKYMTDYTTTMNGKIYFPSRRWRTEQSPESLYGIIRHEAVHLRDMRRFPLLFQLSYLLLLPTVLTFRAVWEWRAYTETLRVHAELTGQIEDQLLDSIQKRFTGPDYLFMFPFPGFIRRRLERLRDKILGQQM
jgi:hypothetical protein